MEHRWSACLVVGVLSIGAGVAIAGLPNNLPPQSVAPIEDSPSDADLLAGIELLVYIGCDCA